MMPRNPNAVGFQHMSATREYLLRFLDTHPDEWGSLVEGAKSFAEARAFLRNGPPFHPLGHCPDFDHTAGLCPGHTRP